jgi:hypothetical protein
MNAFSTFDIDSVVVYEVLIFRHLVPPMHCCLFCCAFVAFRGEETTQKPQFYRYYDFNKITKIKFKFVITSLQNKHIYVHLCFI